MLHTPACLRARPPRTPGAGRRAGQLILRQQLRDDVVRVRVAAIVRFIRPCAAVSRNASQGHRARSGDGSRDAAGRLTRTSEARRLRSQGLPGGAGGWGTASGSDVIHQCRRQGPDAAGGVGDPVHRSQRDHNRSARVGCACGFHPARCECKTPRAWACRPRRSARVSEVTQPRMTHVPPASSQSSTAGGASTVSMSIAPNSRNGAKPATVGPTRRWSVRRGDRRSVCSITSVPTLVVSTARAVVRWLPPAPRICTSRAIDTPASLANDPRTTRSD